MITTKTQPELSGEELFKDYIATFYKRTIPSKYLGFRLTDLQPSDKSRLPLDEQAALYAEMREHPLDSWAFFAPAGFSKTVSSTVLYRQAIMANMARWWDTMYNTNNYQTFEFRVIEHGQPWTPEIPRIYVWRMSVPDLLQQHFNMFNHKDGEGPRPPKPDITAEKIQEGINKGFKPRVFLEEIDKIRPSEFVIDQIFKLFDVIDRNQCQLVIDSNLSTTQFTDVFGEPIARRVKENCRVKEWGF